MPKYSVSAKVVGSKYIGTFKANTPDEAEELAWESDECNVSLCHQCARECEDGEIEMLHVELVEE